MTDITSFPIPTEILDPANYPEFVGATGDPGPPGDQGEPGPPGEDGNTILSGTGAPSDLDDGVNGDYYIDPTAQLIYGPKADGAWPAGVSIKGEQGVKGDSGDPGPKGDTGDPGPKGDTGDPGDITSSGDATDGQVLTADGEGGVAWEDPAATITVVDALNSTSSTDALSAAQGKALNDSKLAASGGTLTNVKETIYYVEADANITIDFSNGDVQYIYVNPAGASIQITLPADPGAISKAGILFVKNNTDKAHTWNTSPAIRFADQSDADTVPTPAAVGYYTRYTCQWNDNNGGTGAWWVTVAGRDTA